jgi:hypothetical protein
MGLDILGSLGAQTDAKFLVRDFRNAARLTPGVNPPRQKFQGYVNFILNRELYSEIYGDKSQNEFRTQISSLIRTADLPSVVFQTETKNAFNMKKIINTGVTYNPVNMTVFDTVGNEWLTTLMKYFSFHFMDPRNAQKQDDRDIAAGNVREGGVKNINSQFGTTSESQFDSNAAGYNLNPSAQFFERIDYVLYHGNKGVQYSIINPMMSEFKPGNIDYGSSDVQEFSMSFDYERFTVYNKLNFELGADDVDRFEQLGAISGDLFEDDVAKPLVLETGRTLDILGTEEEQRERTLQPTIAKEQPADPGGTDASNSGDTQEDTAQEGNGDETDETSTEPVEGVPGTYAAEYDPNQMAGATGGDGEGGLFSDILGDVADSALSAVLRGQNVKDAILTTAVNRVSTSLGESINESISPSDAIKKESPNQSTDTNPGDS